VDHVAAAGRLVQPVDVLCDELLDAPVVLELRECAVRAVRARGTHPFPAREAARPVALTRVLAADEVLQRHRPRRALPLAIGVAIVRDAGARAAARAGEHEQPPVACEEFGKSCGHEVSRACSDRSARLPPCRAPCGATALAGAILAAPQGRATD